jgi:parvulin-like peptidyl-prolyl isomerase
MTKQRYLIFGIVLLLAAAGTYAYTDYAKGNIIYLKANRENLRNAPNGDRIGTLAKGTSMVVLDDQGKWVKVAITGWIWKESTTLNRRELKGPRYRALQILLKTPEEAEQVLNELIAGADFREVAKKRSIGPNAQRGGDLGYFYKGDFQPEFEEAILKLKPGEISGVVKTSLGYHIFKRIE